MGLIDKVRSWFTSWLLQEGGAEYTTYYDRVELMRSYRAGKQRPQIKVKSLQPDDNLNINFCSLVVDRSVSLLFGGGIEIDMGKDTKKQKYIDGILNANKQEILLHRIGVLGAEAGDCYVKIIPDGLKQDDGIFHRLIALDPALVNMVTDPQDFEHINAYDIRYNTHEVIDGRLREVAYWERTQHKNAVIATDKGIIYQPSGKLDETQWEVVLMRATDASSGRWELMGEPTPWEFDFPPIVHWQNLPNPVSCYGVPDLTEDVIVLQDSINFTASNVKKVIRLHGHPILVAKGFKMEKADAGPDKVIEIPGTPDASFTSVEMQSELVASNAFLLMLRQTLFDITRTVDIDSVADKLGTLTNFGLRVLYADALYKLGTKRELYGDGIEELVRRLLILGDFDSNPGVIVWPEMLPENEVEVLATQKSEIELGLKSLETVSTERGINYEQEQKLIGAKKDAEGGKDEEVLMRLLNRGT